MTNWRLLWSLFWPIVTPIALPYLAARKLVRWWRGRKVERRDKPPEWLDGMPEWWCGVCECEVDPVDVYPGGSHGPRHRACHGPCEIRYTERPQPWQQANKHKAVRAKGATPAPYGSKPDESARPVTREKFDELESRLAGAFGRLDETACKVQKLEDALEQPADSGRVRAWRWSGMGWFLLAEGKMHHRARADRPTWISYGVEIMWVPGRIAKATHATELPPHEAARLYEEFKAWRDGQ